MRFKHYNILFFGAVIIFFTACSNTKYLAGNQNLFVGSQIKIESSARESKSSKKELDEELEKLVRPRPNSKTLGLRIKLWAYNIAGKPKPKAKGLRNWLKYKFGEPPVIADYSVLQKSSAVMQNRLENRGYFHDSVTLDTIAKHKKLTAKYTASIHNRYRIGNTTFPADSNDISNTIQTDSKSTLLKQNRFYDLDRIKAERERINADLKQKGYFYFSPNYIFVDADTTVGEHKVDMDVRFKPETPPDAKKAYFINDVFVYADYDIRSDTVLSSVNAKKFQGYTIVDSAHRFNPKIFSRTLVFKPGDIYNRDDHNLSLNRLITLGVYKFVKVRFENVDTAIGNKLNAFYYLTPTEKKSIRAEVSGLTKSNNSTGTELTISWRNRNFLKGAELFTVGAYAGIEQQFSSQQNNTTLRLGGDLNLYVPRIISPFKLNTSGAFVPKTRFNLGYELYSSDTLYTLNSFRGSYGYQWKQRIQSEHQLNLINITFVQPTKISETYQSRLDTTPILQRAIEKQFILGSNYNYNFNSLASQNTRFHNFYFNGNVDLSGNLMGIISGANINEGKQKGLFNVPISQYIRVEAEYRHYLRLSKYTSFAGRIWGGLGYAYGNSNTMPFIKQFFAGGTNDIRAFRSRSLGPGSYYAGNSKTLGYLPEQPGDIKLEANLEYRGAFSSIFRWALFADAGNVWTYREDSSRPGAKFSNNWLNEIAAGVGAGIRIDISILILRVDVAFPVRKPYLPRGEQWTKLDFGSSDWRKENLVVNLAIGYPF